MLSMNPDGVIYMVSFSKILTPGIRLGYVVAPRPLIEKLEQAKHATDLHTAQLTRMVIYNTIKGGFLDGHIPAICTLYSDQCEAMPYALQTYFPSQCSWTWPEGGMFIWVTLSKHIDSMQLLDEAVEQHVAFVPGASFYGNTPEKHTLRLSFLTVPPARIREGIERLGKRIASKARQDAR